MLLGVNLFCSLDFCKNGGICNGNLVNSLCLCLIGFIGFFCEGKIFKWKLFSYSIRFFFLCMLMNFYKFFVFVFIIL